MTYFTIKQVRALINASTDEELKTLLYSFRSCEFEVTE